MTYQLRCLECSGHLDGGGARIVCTACVERAHREAIAALEFKTWKRYGTSLPAGSFR